MKKSTRSARRYTAEEVWQADGGIMTLGEDELRALVSVALSKVPRRVADKVFKGCIFVMAKYEWGRGTYIPKELLRNKCVIALSERLMDEERPHAERTILHEVAHFYLSHMPPGLVPACSEDHESRLEEEADRKAEEWLRSFRIETSNGQKRRRREPVGAMQGN
jgi:hypothetical protein